MSGVPYPFRFKNNNRSSSLIQILYVIFALVVAQTYVT